MEESSARIADKTVVRCLGFGACGRGANTCAVDVKDGRIARIRPLHYDTRFKPEELNAWKLEAHGHTFDPGFKSLIPPLTLAYKTRASSPNRIPYPLRREDWDPRGERHPETRGTSKYVRISWDEATDIIAAEIKRIHDEYGPRSILCQADGHGESNIVHAAHGCQTNLFELVGGYTGQARQPDSWEGWYWGAKHVWGMDPIGQQTNVSNVIQDVARNCDAVIYWGADPETTPWGWEGQQASRICYWLTECGVQSIWIAPDCNYANGIHADKWIPILPNTDAALQLAIAYVWLVEGTYEKDYLESHAVGFDWFEYYVLGQEDGIPKTPAWAAEKCGIPSYRIKALARYWAKSKVSIAHCDGGGFIRSAYSHEPARLEVYLLGMRGLGQPGVNQFKLVEWSLMNMRGVSPLPPSEVMPVASGAFRGAPLGSVPESIVPKTMVPQAILGEHLSWFGHVTCAMPRADQFVPMEFPLPGDNGIHMIWSDSPSWSTCWNQGSLLQDALRSENLEFYLVQHPWMENDCLFADLILPTCTTFEVEDFNTDNQGGQWNIIAFEEQAIDAVGEALSDYLLVAEVAKKLERYGGVYENLAERYTGGKDVRGWIENGFNTCGIGDELGFEEFLERQFHLFPTRENWQDEPVGMMNFYEDPESFPLETPSGKLEYYSASLAEAWPDDRVRGPVAHWIEQDEGHDERIAGPRAKNYPFLLVSNHPRWRVHSQHDDMPWLREIGTCKVKGPDGYAYEPVWVNPVDAEKLGIADGDIVKLFNERGSVLGGAVVSERIMPGALYQDHGARVDTIVPGVGGLDRGGANNLICPNATTSKNTVGEVTNGFLVGIEKVDVPALAGQYPEAFARAYDGACGLVAAAYIVEGEQA